MAHALAVSTTTDLEPAAHQWAALRLFCVYRLVLSLLMLGLHAGLEPAIVGGALPAMFRAVLALYMAFALLALVASHRQCPAFTAQVHLQFGVDIVAIVMLMNASGGPPSGVGMLLVIVVAGTSLILSNRMALLFAALASTATLIEVLYGHIADAHTPDALVQAGLLGVTLFATALLFRVLVKRARASEALAEQRGIDLANLAALNEQIIQHTPSGLLVIDRELQIHHVNEAARRLLRIDTSLPTDLRAVSGQLAHRLQAWRHAADAAHTVLPDDGGLGQIQLRFHRLGSGGSGVTLISLDDVSALTERHQQAKLAALGRLTASIAHEVRNPLGAISHAAQLLAESADLLPQDRRLTEIIYQQSVRVNRIVESVLKLSRREPPVDECIALRGWIEDFAERLCAALRIPRCRIAAHTMPLGLTIRFDERHLEQILTNLCTNALDHGGESVHLQIRAERVPPSATPRIEVTDDGPGIPEEVRSNVFDPFFTTSRKGTGLGLYIASLLCEMNHARLAYIPDAAAGACFRIELLERKPR